MRDVPDFFAHLRRDARGLPVPYVNVWGAEDVARMSVAFDRFVQRDAAFIDDTNETVPDFTRQHMGRQRRCMVEGLCQVCARKVPWSRRFLIVSSVSVRTIDVEGRRRNVITEPWLDERCARFAITHCPALIRRRRDDDLWLTQVHQRECQLSVSTGWLDDFPDTLVNPVAMWVNILLPVRR